MHGLKANIEVLNTNLNIKILDVTLRDGGYQTNFHFSNELTQQLLTKLDRSGIDYIEVGYRNGTAKHIPNIGDAGICPNNYLKYCRQWIKHAKLTVICHSKNITKSDIRALKDCGVDAVRIVVPYEQNKLSFKYLTFAKELDLEVFANITHVTKYKLYELNILIKKLKKIQLTGIYLADSNGSLLPSEVETIFSKLRATDNGLGFHPHDNLCLAQANAIIASNNHVKFFDTSLLGLGKGAGNLRTEGFVSYLISKGCNKYNLCALLEAAKFLKINLEKAYQNLSVRDMILGVFNLSQEDALKLGELSSIAEYYGRAKEFHNQTYK